MEKGFSNKRLRLIRSPGEQSPRANRNGWSPRLFSAYSIGQIEHRDILYHHVCIHWYCLERTEPPAPYDRLIAEYDRLPPRIRQFMETEVNRYFTESEVQALRQFLATRYRLAVVAEEISIPAVGAGAFRRDGADEVFHFLELDRGEGYDLPITVWGYYTLARCPTSPVLAAGVEFLEKALEGLGAAGLIDSPELGRVVAKLYSEDGLYVVRDRKSC